MPKTEHKTLGEVWPQQSTATPLVHVIWTLQPQITFAFSAAASHCWFMFRPLWPLDASHTRYCKEKSPSSYNYALNSSDLNAELNTSFFLFVIWVSCSEHSSLSLTGELWEPVSSRVTRKGGGNWKGADSVLEIPSRRTIEWVVRTPWPGRRRKYHAGVRPEGSGATFLKKSFVQFLYAPAMLIHFMLVLCYYTLIFFCFLMMNSFM